MIKYGKLLYELGKYKEAEECLFELKELMERSTGVDHQTYSSTMWGLF